VRPRLLDLFAGAQGAGVGYARAGFEVHAVDIEAHDKHPEIESFIVADALDVLADVGFCRSFHVRHASPPCPRYSTITPAASRDLHPDLIGPVRDRLRAIGGPYVIENVVGARPYLDHPIRLCGSSFGLRVERHRLFETSPMMWAPPLCRHADEPPVGVYGDHPEECRHLRPDGTERGRKARDLPEGRDAMGIDWMDWDDLTDAVPPAYTTWIGDQLLTSIAAERAS
jgi:DNA (cytosine-5)-methyltransferase 1